MNAGFATVVALCVYALGYFVYGRFLARRVFCLRKDVGTPAHTMNDGVDYVPTPTPILFGHHYASIAGLAPMLGPAVAVIWGWLPAMLWVVFGSLLIGCVQDFGALVLSVRAQGQSIGYVAESIIGSRAKTLFHVLIFFLVSLAMGVFVYVIAFLFSPAPTAEQAVVHFPQAVTPSFGLMLIAAVMGWFVHKNGMSWRVLGPIGVLGLGALMFFGVNETWLEMTGLNDPNRAPDVSSWSVILLVYAFAAAILPVWSLLQPRDFLNGILLYIGLGALYSSVIFGAPEFVAPAIRPHPEDAPSIFPFVFIVIACGAASGFHSLVASGTTAKQLDKETDAQIIGYGGMIGESLLGLMAVLATTAGMGSSEDWHHHYASWGSVQGLGAKIGVFIQGCAQFLTELGIAPEFGASFVSIIVVSYALTSLDSATRLLRYNVEEIADTMKLKILKNRYASSLVAVFSIAFFAFFKVDGKSAGLSLWGLFGTTNQLMATVALLTITLYLYSRGKRWWVTALPTALMLTATFIAMLTNIQRFQVQGNWTLFGVGVALFLVALWVVIESILALRRYKSSKTNLPLDIKTSE